MLFLNAETLAKLLCVSVSSSYELMHEKDFPAIRIGSRLIIPKGKLQHWIDEKTGKWGQYLNKKYSKRDPIKDYFHLPNEIFCLGLYYGEIAVYSYLLCRENRKSFQCSPSYKTIGKALHILQNTGCKYFHQLEERELIATEPTAARNSKGKKLNGNLLYTILPIK